VFEKERSTSMWIRVVASSSIMWWLCVLLCTEFAAVCGRGEHTDSKRFCEEKTSATPPLVILLEQSLQSNRQPCCRIL
jgi:hypothetical protein